jgi:hypothetical protein
MRSLLEKLSFSVLIVLFGFVGTTFGEADNISGSTDFVDGKYVIKGDGEDIWNTADAFRFVYKISIKMPFLIWCMRRNCMSA